MTVLRKEEDGPPLRFTLRLEHFSGAVAQGGVFSSLVFRSGASGSGWNLTAHVDGSEATVFRLQRRGDPLRERRYVRVRLTVVDCLGSSLLSAKRQLLFQGGPGESQPVMRVKGDQMAGWCGLKSLCFLPNDTLTLRCEIAESRRPFQEEPVAAKTPQDRGVTLRELYLLSVLASGVPLA